MGKSMLPSLNRMPNARPDCRRFEAGRIKDSLLLLLASFNGTLELVALSVESMVRLRSAGGKGGRNGLLLLFRFVEEGALEPNGICWGIPGDPILGLIS